MDLQDIKALIDAMQRLDLAEMEVSRHGTTLRMERRGQGAAPDVATRRGAEPVRAASVPAAPASFDLHAPLAGVLHLGPAPGAPAFVAPGQAVRSGDALCIIEAMKVFNQIRAECSGTIAAVLVEAGAEVEAGQLLMRIT